MTTETIDVVEIDELTTEQAEYAKYIAHRQPDPDLNGKRFSLDRTRYELVEFSEQSKLSKFGNLAAIVGYVCGPTWQIVGVVRRTNTPGELLEARAYPKFGRPEHVKTTEIHVSSGPFQIEQFDEVAEAFEWLKARWFLK